MVTRSFHCHFARDPFFNMAFDEWMFANAMGQPGSVQVRLYSWNEGAITFGLNQILDRAVCLNKLGDTPLIRRMTGGRALFHDKSELTYSMALNLNDKRWSEWAGSTSRAYERLAELLRNFLIQIGIDASQVRRTNPEIRPRTKESSPPCFASVARHEIVAGKSKIIASAQRQIGDTLLQHGAIKLSGLASHPALPGLVAPSGRLQALDHERFDNLSRQFRAVVEDALGFRLDDEVDSTEGESDLIERLQWVRSAPLDRRDTFEH